MIKLLKKIWNKVFRKDLNLQVMPMVNFGGNIPLSQTEVSDEIKTWLERIGLSHIVEQGVLFRKDSNLPNGMSVLYSWLDKKGIEHVYPDSFRISHSSMKSLRGTLDILEKGRKNKLSDK